MERAAAALAMDNLVTINLDLGLEGPVRDYLAERRATLDLDWLGVLGPDGHPWFGSGEGGLFQDVAALLGTGRLDQARAEGGLSFFLAGPGEGISAGSVSRIVADRGEVLGFLVAGYYLAPGSRLLKGLSEQLGAALKVMPDGRAPEAAFATEELDGVPWLFKYLVLGGTEKVGALGVGIRKADFLSGRKETILSFLAVFIGAGLTSLVLGLFFSRSITHRVQALVAGTERMAGGDFGQAIPVLKDDELGALARSFNTMSLRLGESLRELNALNASLESRIAERTEELSAANEELGTTIENLEATMAQLVESEKMASLGQLVASIAHELNTPLGAISSANEGMDDQLRDVLHKLPALRAALAGSDDARVLDELLARAMVRQPLKNRSSADRAAERELGKRLLAAGSNQAEELAEGLTELGISELDDRLLSALLGPQGPGMVALATTVAWLVRSREIIASASTKAARTILALKTYSHLDPVDAVIEFDVRKELDTILDLYYGMTKKGVEVVRNYSEVPKLRGRRDNLNQVWVNLINNALQAMEYRGALGISVAPVAGGIEVAVSDNGPGMAPVIQDRIFEAFFTTKRQGEGSGLGLPICKRIVESHGGTIGFESAPGRTVFRVFLPSATPKPSA